MGRLIISLRNIRLRLSAVAVYVSARLLPVRKHSLALRLPPNPDNRCPLLRERSNTY